MYKRLLLSSIDDSVENSIGGRPYPRTETPGAETPEKNIDDSVENSMWGGRPQKFLVYKRLLLCSIDDSVYMGEAIP